MVSSIGYVVLSGNMQVERQDTTFLTLYWKLVSNTLSLMCIFLRWKKKIYIVNIY